jgi:hypothetical protein
MEKDGFDMNLSVSYWFYLRSVQRGEVSLLKVKKVWLRLIQLHLMYNHHIGTHLQKDWQCGVLRSWHSSQVLFSLFSNVLLCFFFFLLN